MPTTSFGEGRLAYRNGYHLEDNPYGEISDPFEFHEWQQGWYWEQEEYNEFRRHTNLFRNEV